MADPDLAKEGLWRECGPEQWVSGLTVHSIPLWDSFRNRLFSLAIKCLRMLSPANDGLATSRASGQ